MPHSIHQKTVFVDRGPTDCVSNFFEILTLTLTFSLVSYGQDMQKVKVKGHSVQKLKWK